MFIVVLQLWLMVQCLRDHFQRYIDRDGTGPIVLVSRSILMSFGLFATIFAGAQVFAHQADVCQKLMVVAAFTYCFSNWSLYLFLLARAVFTQRLRLRESKRLKRLTYAVGCGLVAYALIFPVMLFGVRGQLFTTRGRPWPSCAPVVDTIVALCIGGLDAAYSILELLLFLLQLWDLPLSPALRLAVRRNLLAGGFGMSSTLLFCLFVALSQGHPQVMAWCATACQLDVACNTCSVWWCFGSRRKGQGEIQVGRSPQPQDNSSHTDINQTDHPNPVAPASALSFSGYFFGGLELREKSRENNSNSNPSPPGSALAQSDFKTQSVRNFE
eukprot:g58477.t1